MSKTRKSLSLEHYLQYIRTLDTEQREDKDIRSAGAMISKKIIIKIINNSIPIDTSLLSHITD